MVPNLTSIGTPMVGNPMLCTRWVGTQLHHPPPRHILWQHLTLSGSTMFLNTNIQIHVFVALHTKCQDPSFKMWAWWMSRDEGRISKKCDFFPSLFSKITLKRWSPIFEEMWFFSFNFYKNYLKLSEILNRLIWKELWIEAYVN